MAQRKSGFTLVELLVVIGIIAVLISILLPALNKARIAGNKVVCLSNLHQIGLAMTNYAAENQGWWPQASSDKVSPFGWGTWQGTTWDEALLPYLGTQISWNSEANTPPTPGNVGVFRCPFMSYYAQLTSWGGADTSRTPYSSYALNLGYSPGTKRRDVPNFSNPYPWVGLKPVLMKSTAGLSVNEIAIVADRYVWGDAASGYMVEQMLGFEAWRAGMYDVFDLNHVGTTPASNPDRNNYHPIAHETPARNALFTDGHAESVLLKDVDKYFQYGLKGYDW